MASKSAYRQSEPGAEIEELLDTLETAVDRLRTMYEQYFLGIAKTAPAHLHTDAERKLREIAQIQIRNTALRYRLATLQQKFGSYNNYWRRTLRQIENGTYVRSLSKVKRKALEEGGMIPEEILAAMPKRMREQVLRDRDAALSIGKRRGQVPARATDDYEVDLSDISELEDDADVAEISSPVPKQDLDADYAGFGKVHRIESSEMDTLDIEQLLDDLVAPDVRRRASETAETMRPRRDETRPGVGRGVAPAGPREPAAAGTRPPASRASTVAGPPGAPRRGALTPDLPPPGQAPRTPTAATPRLATQPLGRAGAGDPGARARAPSQPGRAPSQPGRAPSQPRLDALPPGMTEGDVRTLYQKYAKAREMVGERNDDSTYQALMRTLHQQAPKIMAQYNAKGVEFGVVIKDKQVVLKAKPK